MGLVSWSSGVWEGVWERGVVFFAVPVFFLFRPQFLEEQHAFFFLGGGQAM